MRSTEIFLPVRNPLKVIKFTDSFAGYGSKASFSVNLSEDDNTVRLFLDALQNKNIDDAKTYVSKAFSGKIDYAELAANLEGINNYKRLAKIEFNPGPKNCRTNSILLIGDGLRKNCIIHLRMVSEPDRYGKWKIYGVEREF